MLKTVHQVERPVSRPSPQGLRAKRFSRSNTQFALACFYIALNWLGNKSCEPNNVSQRFNTYMADCDVDPHTQIGSTRLSLIIRTGDQFRLAIAPDVDSKAASADGDLYSNPGRGFARCTSRSPIADLEGCVRR
jgi:hypothetical protein